MNKTELIKKLGAILIIVVLGVGAWGLSSLGTISLSGKDLLLISTFILGGILAAYYIISYYTGAKLSDIEQLKQLLKQLLGDAASDSNESTIS